MGFRDFGENGFRAEGPGEGLGPNPKHYTMMSNMLECLYALESKIVNACVRRLSAMRPKPKSEAQHMRSRAFNIRRGHACFEIPTLGGSR